MQVLALIINGVLETWVRRSGTNLSHASSGGIRRPVPPDDAGLRSCSPTATASTTTTTSSSKFFGVPKGAAGLRQKT
jgi:hypothetical protein